MNCNDYFNQIAKPGKCEVCGAEEPVVVLSSSLGACSCAYCKECYNFGLEPYNLCVSTVWSCGWENMADLAKARIRKILTKLGKTEEEMLADVKVMDDSFIAAMQNYEEYCHEQDIKEEL